MKKTIDLDRRTLLTGAVATVLASSTACATSNTGESHHHHHMGKMGNKHENLVKTALDCIEKGERCIEHCTRLVAAGDTSIAECMRKVNETLPMCHALVKLGIYDSDHLAALAKVCIDVCGDCEKECLKHADKHPQCKACADSCSECIKACKEVIT